MSADYARRPKIRYCGFCKDKIECIDYKDVALLKRHVSDRGKIKPRRVTGNCKQHQRQLSIAVKRAREMGLLAYTTKL